MMNSNWKEDELKLTLELYLSKDLDWLSKMTEKTEEVVGLSQLLNHFIKRNNMAFHKLDIGLLLSELRKNYRLNFMFQILQI